MNATKLSPKRIFAWMSGLAIACGSAAAQDGLVPGVLDEVESAVRGRNQDRDEERERRSIPVPPEVRRVPRGQDPGNPVRSGRAPAPRRQETPERRIPVTPDPARETIEEAPRGAEERLRGVLGEPSNIREPREVSGDQQRVISEFVTRLRSGVASPENRSRLEADVRADVRGGIEVGPAGDDRRDRGDRRWFRDHADVHHGPVHHRHRHYNRAIRYLHREDIPEVLRAAAELNFIAVNRFENHRRFGSGYELAYEVDRSSRISRDDILFRQGSTRFADRYSATIVENLAYAMHDPSLRGHRFVIEGHASAEGGYSSNLYLSQRRAEAIARIIVEYGVHPSRLVPVGYGETEALYRADAPESLRRLDRRVVVYRLRK